MSQFVQLPATPKGDNGGVHINSGIINHAFYLLAEGMNGAIGMDAAEQIFYRTLVFHLTPRSQFIDARLALIQSATEIFGKGSVQVQKTGEAFDAVEIFDAPPTQDNSTPTIINGPDATTFLRLTPTGAITLNRLDPALEDPDTGVIHSSFSLDAKRPSVSRDGSLIAFINSNHELCLINSVNNLDESCLEQTATFNSVAISPDGNKFALVLLDAAGNPEDQILIIDTSPNGQTQRINLVAAATDNASTISLSHADAMDFSNDGNILIYDALNELTAADGSRISAWSIYALNLVNETTITVIPPVSGFNFGFPSLSQTTDNYLAFDAFNQNTETNTVTIASLITGELRSIDTASNLGIPSFTGDDSAIVFSRPDAATTTGSSLFKQPLAADHITPSGASELWLKNAEYGVIYRRGDTTNNGDGLDIDGNGELDALTDGLLVIRYLFGLTEDPLTENAVASNCTRCDNSEIRTYLAIKAFLGNLDVDNNGSRDALTDGLLVIRYVFGLTGDALTDGAVATNCTRCNHTEIESFLGGL